MKPGINNESGMKMQHIDFQTSVLQAAKPEMPLSIDVATDAAPDGACPARKRDRCRTGRVSVMSVRPGPCVTIAPMLETRSTVVPTFSLGFAPSTVSFGAADPTDRSWTERLAIAFMVLTSMAAVFGCLTVNAGLVQHWPRLVQWVENLLVIG